MLLQLITFLALSIGVQSQERFFFGNRALATITKSSQKTVTSTLFPTCFEVLSTTQCARKKKQLTFLVNPFDYYYGVHPQPVYGMQPSAPPEFRYFSPYNQVYNPFIIVPAHQPQPEPATIESSIKEKAESEGRLFGTKLIQFTTIYGTVTVPTVASNTQTYQVSCLATGQSTPTTLCSITMNFPPVPVGATLQQYCSSLASAAKMAFIECKYASRRKRQQNNTSRVIVVFTQIPGGEPPSRPLIAGNISAKCNKKDKCAIIPGFPPISLAEIVVPGFITFNEAAGSSSAATGSAQG